MNDGGIAGDETGIDQSRLSKAYKTMDSDYENQPKVPEYNAYAINLGSKPNVNKNVMGLQDQRNQSPMPGIKKVKYTQQV